jgi:hypothetical protein
MKSFKEFLTENSDDIEINKINSMSHTEMAKLYRFAPSGHPYFRSDLPYNEIFMKRFNELGGMNTDVSKEIGWDKK